MLGILLESQSGESLQISTGKSARVRFAIPSSLQSEAPSTIPLWWFNETDGLWKQEGSAIKTADYYEGNVSHFSFWNCDAPNATVYLAFTVHTSNGPFQGAHAKITRISGGNSTYGYTDSTGFVGGLVFKNEMMALEIINNCNDVIYSKNIGPFSQNTNLGTLTISLIEQFVLNVSGNAENCSSAPVTNGNAFIYWDGQSITTPITNGHFSTTVTKCTNGSSVEIIITDYTTQQVSTTWTGTSSTSELNAGTLTACSVPFQQFINYSVNGIPHVFSDPPDSIIMRELQAPVNLIKIIAFRAGVENANFYIRSPGLALGSSQEIPNSIYFPEITPATLVTFTPAIFASITEYGNIGQFMSGNFSGTVVTTQPNATYSLSCSFKVKRSF